MTTYEYLTVLRERWRIVALCVLVGLLVGLIVTLLSPRLYAADVKMFIASQAPADNSAAVYEGGQLAQQRVTSYQEIITSEAVATEVVRRLQLDLTPAEVSDEITASAQPETVLLTATVSDTSPDRAAAIANTTAAVFGDVVADLERPTDSRFVPSLVVRVVQPATPPVTAYSPRPGFALALGALAGLLAGLGLALIQSALDRSIKSEAQARDLARRPILGKIPFDDDLRSQPIAVGGSQVSARGETYRQLRTNLRFLDVNRPPQAIMIASPARSEGRTTTALNLAVAMATAGSKVLVIEADLRAPSVASYLGLSGSVGLTDVLAGSVDLTNAVQSRAAPGVDVLVSGPVPTNPTELLGSNRMVDLVIRARNRYDAVIIDSSAVLPDADAITIAPLVDAVIVLSRMRFTTSEQLIGAMQALTTVSGRVVGAVLTAVRAETGPRRHRRRGADTHPASVPEVVDRGEPVTVSPVGRDDVRRGGPSGAASPPHTPTAAGPPPFAPPSPRSSSPAPAAVPWTTPPGPERPPMDQPTDAVRPLVGPPTTAPEPETPDEEERSSRPTPRPSSNGTTPTTTS